MEERRTTSLARSAVLRTGLIAGIGLAIGALAGWLAYGPGRMPDSLPHVVAGWVAIASGLVAWWRVRWSVVGPLLVVLGFTWFLGDFSSCLNIEPLAHRCLDVGPLGDTAAALRWLWLGVLGHILLCFPDGRARTWPKRAAAAIAYIVAIAIPAMPDVVALLDRVATAATLDLAVSLASITIVAALLAADARRASLTTDRAVGLGDALATALGDPSFRIAFREPTREGWVDAAGRRVRGPEARILETEGLAAALRDLASRSSVPVEVIAAGGVTAGTHVDLVLLYLGMGVLGVAWMAT